MQMEDGTRSRNTQIGGQKQKSTNRDTHDTGNTKAGGMEGETVPEYKTI